ncbi:PAS domain S-box protein, partial [bacterium]|nr:PAS domain S-box protein [bacterium]
MKHNISRIHIIYSLKKSFFIFCLISIFIFALQIHYTYNTNKTITNCLDSIYRILKLCRNLETNKIGAREAMQKTALREIRKMSLQKNYWIWLDDKNKISLINTLLEKKDSHNLNNSHILHSNYKKAFLFSRSFTPWEWTFGADIIKPIPFRLLYALSFFAFLCSFFGILFFRKDKSDNLELSIARELLKNKLFLFSGKTKTDPHIKNFYKNIIETIITGVWVTDKYNKIFYINKGLEDIIGFTKKNIIGKNFFEDLPLYIIKFFKPYYNIARQTLKASYFDCLPVKTISNRKVFLSGWFIPRIKNTKFDGMICTIQNVTERKIAEDELEKMRDNLEKIVNKRTAELKQSNIQLQQEIIEKQRAQEDLSNEKETVQKYLDIAEVILIVISKDQTIQLINKKGCRILGYQENELLGKNWIANFIPENEQAKLTVFIDDLFKGIVQPQEYYEHYINIRSGEKRLIAWHNSLLKDENGFITGLLSSGEDITEQRKQQEALLASEKKYRQLFETSSDGIVFIRSDGIYEDANQAFIKMIGYSLRELKTMSYKDITPKKWLKFQRDIINNQIKTLGCCEELEKEYIRKNGTVFPVIINMWLVKDENDNAIRIMAIIRDITLHKKIEEQKEKVKHLESLGILAGGIAHDFNNLLSGILGNINIALLNSTIPAKTKQVLKLAENASIRAKDLSRQLLTFSKGGAPVKRVIDISQIIKESCQFYFKKNTVKCIFDIDSHLSNIDADPMQMSQVIQNLIINAEQSMGGKGAIHICVSNTELNYNNPYNLNPGEYVLISVKDEGYGIPKENIEKIFDPYFTTKQRGPAKGSGLGLATCFSIIKKHNGYIFAESEEGKGSCFHILLPASQKEIYEITAPAEELIKGHSTILIMDDEQMVREVMGNMLLCLGYTVEFSKNGKEAIKKYITAKQTGKTFDCVILDLTVSNGMGGKETIKKLIQIDPDINAIVTSGYSNDPIIANYNDFGFNGVIVKPIQITELSNTLRKVIQKK